jgi:soluble lytic murein transglycosylase-like protein
MGGTRYLSHCLSQFGDKALALAAYNAGPQRVMAHNGIPLLKETRQFVRRVLAFEKMFRRTKGVL